VQASHKRNHASTTLFGDHLKVMYRVACKQHVLSTHHQRAQCRGFCLRTYKQNNVNQTHASTSDERIVVCDSAAAAAATAVAASKDPYHYSYILPRQAVAMFAAGAVLGPFCDGLHSQNNVLHYAAPSIELSITYEDLHWSFESCWWVPMLFGLAGCILGVGVPVLDSLKKPHHTQDIQQQRTGQGD
jgi:hypothetical protein